MSQTVLACQSQSFSQSYRSILPNSLTIFLYIYVLASNLGYLLRFRYGCHHFFFIVSSFGNLPLNTINKLLLFITIQSPSQRIMKKHIAKKTAMLFCSFHTLNSHHLSLLIAIQYLTIKIFLFLLPIHSYPLIRNPHPIST